MKIVHVSEHLERRGGVETYLLNLLPLLAGRGFEQEVLFGGGDKSLFDRSKAFPDIRTAEFRRSSEIYTLTTRLLRDRQPDVVHIHALQNLAVLKACLNFGRTIMTCHDYRFLCPASTYYFKKTKQVCEKTCSPACFTTTLRKRCMTLHPRFTAYYYARSRWACANAGKFRHVVAPSTHARDRLIRSGFSETKISVIPYFCPIQTRPAPREIPATNTVSYIGRLATNKGFDVFLEAFGRMPDSVRAVVVGNFDERLKRNVRRDAEVLGCRDRLELHDWSTPEAVTAILDRTSLFIFPSLWPETLGIIGLEALSRGVPVVASRIGGVEEWLENGVNGYLVQPGSVEDIVSCTGELLAEPEKLSAFGLAGIETVNRRFQPSQHVEELVAVYNKVAEHAMENG